MTTHHDILAINEAINTLSHVRGNYQGLIEHHKDHHRKPEAHEMVLVIATDGTIVGLFDQQGNPLGEPHVIDRSQVLSCPTCNEERLDSYPCPTCGYDPNLHGIAWTINKRIELGV